MATLSCRCRADFSHIFTAAAAAAAVCNSNVAHPPKRPPASSYSPYSFFPFLLLSPLLFLRCALEWMNEWMAPSPRMDSISYYRIRVHLFISRLDSTPFSNIHSDSPFEQWQWHVVLGAAEATADYNTWAYFGIFLLLSSWSRTTACSSSSSSWHKKRGMAERELKVLLLFALLLLRHRLTIRVSCGMRFFLLLLLAAAAAAVLMCIHVRYLAYWLLCAQYQCSLPVYHHHTSSLSLSTRLDSTTIRGGPWIQWIFYLFNSFHSFHSFDRPFWVSDVHFSFLFLPWWRFPSSSSFLVK